MPGHYKQTFYHYCWKNQTEVSLVRLEGTSVQKEKISFSKCTKGRRLEKKKDVRREVQPQIYWE